MSISLEIDDLKLNSEDLDFNIELIPDEELRVNNSITITETPTLESILNESDSDDDSFLIQDSISIDTDRLSNFSIKTKKNETLNVNLHGIICKQIELKQISNQLMNAIDRADAGMPTCITICQLIAIGTSRGLVLIFDSLQILKLYLQTDSKDALSALGFNNDSTRLLVGNATGMIYMFDTNNGKLLRTISDANPTGNAILHLKFTDNPTLAVFSDSGGSVFSLEFTRKMGIRGYDSNCLFSGSRGEVCCIEPLKFELFYKNFIETEKNFDSISDLFKRYQFLAMASFTKVFIIVLKPDLNVLFTHPLPGTSVYLPLLSWQFVLIQNTRKSLNPILAFGRESTIEFVQINYYLSTDSTNNTKFNVSMKFKFIHLKKNEFPYKIFNFSWLNSKTLAILDSKEKLHIVDIKSNEELQCLAFDQIQLVYNSSFFKSLATGGYVSRALSVAGENSCYQTYHTYSGQIFVLGTKSVWLFILQNWATRIDDFVNTNKLDLALDLALAMYQNKVKALVGLPQDPKERSEKIIDKLIDLLYLYINRGLKQDCPQGGRIEVLEAHYKALSSKCAEICLAIDRKDLLFDNIYPIISVDKLVEGYFFESLEEPIVKGRLNSIPPEILSRFVDYFTKKELLANVEKCILHFDVLSMDLNQVTQVCKKNHLYDALISITNRAYDDYISPINDMIQLLDPICFLRNSTAEIRLANKDIVKYGNKLLVYLHCCLCGQAFPFGRLDDIKADSVRKASFDYLINEKNKFIDEIIAYSDSNLKNLSYPLLRILLNFNIVDFLNVISMTFNESSFDAVTGLDKKQNLVDILVKIVLSDNDFTFSQIGVLFTFLARQLSIKEYSLNVDNKIFNQIIEYLCKGKQMDRFEEREQTLISLLNSYGSTISQHYEINRLVEMMKIAKQYKALEIIYEIKQDYHEIIECYLNDDILEDKKTLAFDVIQNLLNRFHDSKGKFNNNRDLQIKNLKNKILKSHIIKQLIQINAKKTVELLWIQMNIDLKNLIRAVRHKYDVIDDEFDNISIKSSSSFNSTVESIEPTEIFYSFMKGLFELIDSIKSNRQYLHFISQLQSEYVELYIDAMCVFEPNLVLPYLRLTSSDYSYRSDECLRICRERKLNDATAYLLEKTGQIEAAFSIHFENLTSLIKDLEKTLAKNTQEEINLYQVKIEALLILIVELCQRSSCSLNDQIKEKIWFTLFDEIMLPLRTFLITSDNNNQKEILREYFKRQGSYIINSMVGYLSLGIVIDKLISNPSHTISKFSDIKELVLKMIEVYSYEKTLLTTTSSLVTQDLHNQLKSYTRQLSKSLSPLSNNCNYCGQSFISNTNTLNYSTSDCYLHSGINIFNCGHWYHRLCLENFFNLNTQKCPECFPTKATVNTNTSTNYLISFSETPSKNDPHKYQSLSISPTVSYNASTEVSFSEQQISALNWLRNRRAVNVTNGVKISQNGLSLSPANISKFF